MYYELKRCANDILIFLHFPYETQIQQMADESKHHQIHLSGDVRVLKTIVQEGRSDEQLSSSGGDIALQGTMELRDRRNKSTNYAEETSPSISPPSKEYNPNVEIGSAGTEDIQVFGLHRFCFISFFIQILITNYTGLSFFEIT